ncbi:hypothetical protein AB1E22_12850 [Buttiauxella gaviniae]|uniref:Uncharacterized protein n=1 Tax=Buttiauxella gaviniae TaxID=82990 RepID=A0ABV3NVK6_9ENTR
MLPNTLVPVPFAFSQPDIDSPEEHSALTRDIQDNLLVLEKTILSTNHYAGQAKNTLLEENDWHLKERLFCVVKIEALVTVLNELIEKEKVSPADMQMLIEDKKFMISEHSQQIWINQLTQEKSWPLFYSLHEPLL